jgi:hypothetical protein
MLEVTRHTPLTDKQVLHYYELPKVPQSIDRSDEQRLWLALFQADTEEQLRQIEEMEVPVMQQAISAYRSVTSTKEFKEAERLRVLARSNETAALRHAAEVEREKWRAIVSEKDAKLSELSKQLEELRARLGE